MNTNKPRLTEVTELGAAWAGNSVNCVPFRHSAILKRRNSHVVSYYDEKGEVVVAEIGSRGTQKHQIENQAMPYDAHQSISMGSDKLGRVHVAWGAHNSELLITRSAQEDLAFGFRKITTLRGSLGITYPMFLQDSGRQLVLVYRRGPHFSGQIMVKRFDTDSSRWLSDPLPLISGRIKQQTCGPYINTPVIGNDGRVALFIVWRLQESASSGGSVVNVGIDCMCSTDGLRSLSTLGGVRINGTVTPICSERVIAVPLGCGLINQAGASQMPDGSPAFATFWNDYKRRPQYRLGWMTTAGWRTTVISKFQTVYEMNAKGTLPLPHSRPEILFHDDGSALVLYRSIEDKNRLVLTILNPPDYNLESSKRTVLVDEDLGQYEPIVSRDSWHADRSLVVYVQHCQQGMGRDGKEDRHESIARLYSWKL